MQECNFAGRTLIKCCEGLRLESYRDTGGVWTIGYGTTRIADFNVTKNMVIHEDQANLYLKRDLAAFERALNELIKVELTENQFSAVCCLVYNIGVDQFKKSTMLKKLNAKDFEGAAKEFGRWVYDNGVRIKGLEQRRKKEKELFLRP